MNKVVVRTLLAMTLLTGIGRFAWAEGTNWQPNDKVEVEEKGKWYPSTVLKTQDGRYFIHYEGYSSRYDLWVGSERVRALGAVTPAAPAQNVHVDPLDAQAYDAAIAAIAAAEDLIAKKAPTKDVLSALGEAQKQVLNSPRLRFHPQYAEVMARYWPVANQEIDFQLQRAMAVAKTATADNYNNVNGTIDDGLYWAGKALQRYEQFAGKSQAEVDRLAALIADGKKAIKDQAQRVYRAMDAKRAMPGDGYGGRDKARVKGLIQAAWKKRFPGVPILALRIPSGWERDAGWQSAAGGLRTVWHDVSKLSVYVVIKKDSQYAGIHRCDAYGNGNNRTDLELVLPSALTAGEQMLLKNVK